MGVSMDGIDRRFPDVQAFVQNVKAATTLESVASLLSEATRLFRFDYFALTQRFGASIDGVPVQLSDFPQDWVAALKAGSGWVNDPVLSACQRTVAPFSWDELPNMLVMSAAQKRYMKDAADKGLVQGWTVPIHLPGEATALCSFVISGKRHLPAESLPAAQFLACFAFEQARRISARKGSPAPRLSRRQLDCVVLAARGKSDWVAGQILGLAPDTVHKYLEAAKARYGVSSRTELVVRALHDGQLSFTDLMG